MKMLRATAFAFTAAIAAAPASAENIDFSATLANVCTLSVPTAGTLALSANGQTLGSEETGGIAATVSVLSIGASQLDFSAPTRTSAAPTGYNESSETVELSYLGAGGLSVANQAYTSGSSQVTLSTIPLSELVLNARILNPNSFADGNYTVRTVMTCS